MSVFDSTTLLYTLDREVSVPLDPATNDPVEDAKARIDLLIQDHIRRDERIIIPTPVLSEVLVHADSASFRYLKTIQDSSSFKIVAFGQRAAVELARMYHKTLIEGGIRAGSNASRAKIKFDRQIIAIAVAENQTTIYSDDNNLAKFAVTCNLKVVRIHELPLRHQQTFDF